VKNGVHHIKFETLKNKTKQELCIRKVLLEHITKFLYGSPLDYISWAALPVLGPEIYQK
jgi:hypothetical protein